MEKALHKSQKHGKCGISSMYIPKDYYGKILGDKEWRGSGAMKNAITLATDCFT